MADKGPKHVSTLAWTGRRSLLGSFAFALPRVYLLIVLVPAFLIAIGTLGYSYLEGCSLFDGLYMTVITLTTVGYGEHPGPLSTHGRVFTIFLLLGGVFTFFWAASEVIRTIVSGEMRGILERVRMERSLAELKEHLIVCGYGRMGRLVCREFSQQKLPFVVIEDNPTLLQEFSLPYGIPMHGDATTDEGLRRARVARARAPGTRARAHAEKPFIVTSAR